MCHGADAMRCSADVNLHSKITKNCGMCAVMRMPCSVVWMAIFHCKTINKLCVLWCGWPLSLQKNQKCHLCCGADTVFNASFLRVRSTSATLDLISRLLHHFLPRILVSLLLFSFHFYVSRLFFRLFDLVSSLFPKRV